MSENEEAGLLRPSPREVAEAVPHPGTPTTRELRTVGQRRRDAESKLEQHLQVARHKNEPHDGHSEPAAAG
ncbi:hypothetical protein [Arthrobacter sp. UYEF20]|uniref:hypothetical protein n=1 Tax=Arthrobacter sp. UYEF20 TaxID=1756363 RepID=UPI00339165B5